MTNPIHVKPRHDASAMLQRIANYVQDEAAQSIVAAAAETIMDGRQQACCPGMECTVTDERFKTDFLGALETLVAAGKLKPDTIKPELGSVIRRFQNEFRDATIPQNVVEIIDAAEKASKATRETIRRMAEARPASRA